MTSEDCWERRKQTFVVIFFLFSFLIAPLLVLFLSFYLLFFSKLWWVMVVYLTWMYLDFDFAEKGGRPWDRMRNAKVWDHMARYFPMELVKTAELCPEHNYILAWHPHGIISLSAVVNMCTNGTRFLEKYPGIRRYLATLNIHFAQPFRREVIGAFGAIGASFNALSCVLNRPLGGNAIALVVGGAEEALEGHEHNFKLCLDKRKGFVKLALKTGACLVPVYSFGETSTYYQIPNPPGSRLRKWQTKVKQWIGLSPVLVKGVGLFENSFGILPFRTRVVTVVGAPISVSRTENPTSEQIDQLHRIYKIQLIQLFEAHKSTYNIPNHIHLEFY